MALLITQASGSRPASPSPSDPVRQRIMDAAERLFSEEGFAATSLRQITAEAGVNLAAVNYHFGSKENLHLELIARAVSPLNEQRLALLDAAESAAAPHPASIEAILDAFGRPCFDLARRPESASTLRLLAKSLHENEQHMRALMERECRPIIDRFLPALTLALPGCPPERILWGFHFTFGSLVHALTQSHALKFIAPGQCDFTPLETTLTRWITFSAAGLRAAAQGAP